MKKIVSIATIALVLTAIFSGCNVDSTQNTLNNSQECQNVNPLNGQCED